MKTDKNCIYKIRLAGTDSYLRSGQYVDWGSASQGRAFTKIEHCKQHISQYKKKYVNQNLEVVEFKFVVSRIGKVIIEKQAYNTKVSIVESVDVATTA